MSNVIALTLRAEASRRATDGYDDAWNAYFRSVYRIFDREAAMQMADAHVDRMKQRDAEILAAVAAEMADPQHA